MTHNESWHFCRLGRMLERADKTSRILDVKYFLLLPTAADVGTTSDDIQWAAVLRSASAFEMYRKSHGRIAPDRVVEFLLFETEFPRAIQYCLMRARESVHAISGTPAGMFRHPVERLFGELCSELAYARVETIITAGLHEYLDRLQTKMNQVGNGISETFFAARGAPPVRKKAKRTKSRRRRSSCERRLTRHADAGLFDDAHLDLHAAERRGRTDERAPQRQRVPLVPRHGHANEVAIPDDAVGGIEVDPSGSRQVRLHPAVRRSAADGGGAGFCSGTKM